MRNIKPESAASAIASVSEKLKSLFGNDATVEKVALLDIDAQEKVWLICYGGFFPARELHMFACDFAERALASQPEYREEATVALETVRKWVRGEITGKELSTAMSWAWRVLNDGTYRIALKDAWGASCFSATTVASNRNSGSFMDAMREERKWQLSVLSSVV